MKFCPDCKTEKDESEFAKRTQSNDGLKHNCKLCQKKYDKERNKRIKITQKPIIITKVCSKCGVEKDASDFGRWSVSKDGLAPKCKLCKREYDREYNKQRENIPKLNILSKICSKCKLEKDKSEFPKNANTKTGLYAWCRCCQEQYNKKYKLEHKAEIKVQRREYKATHKEEIREYNKSREEENRKYKLEHKEESRKYHREYDKNRKLIDLNFKLHARLSNAIYLSLKRSGSSKAGESCFDHIPYTTKRLISYIESLFEWWMNWDNWGRYNPQTWDDNDHTTWTWQIDHIIPKSHFHFTSMDDPEFQKCWALENLRPYSAKQNLLDGNRR